MGDKLPAAARRVLEQKRPFEFRPVHPPDSLRRDKSPPHKYIWFRAVDKLADEEALHRCLLAYVSDFHLLHTALQPHGISTISPHLVIASFDHAMCIHRILLVDASLPYAWHRPITSESR